MKVRKAEPAQAITANIRKTKQESFSRFCKDEGFVQADALGALIDWLMGLDPTTRLLVMDKLDERDAGAVARIALERIISSSENGEGGTEGGPAPQPNGDGTPPDEESLDDAALEREVDEQRRQPRRRRDDKPRQAGGEDTPAS